MAQFEYLIEWRPRNADFWRVSNTTHCVSVDAKTAYEAFDKVNPTLWNDERIWAYRFDDVVFECHMLNDTVEKKKILELKGWN